MLLFVCTTTRQRFVIFTALSQSDCRNFSCSSITESNCMFQGVSVLRPGMFIREEWNQYFCMNRGCLACKSFSVVTPPFLLLFFRPLRKVVEFLGFVLTQVSSIFPTFSRFFCRVLWWPPSVSCRYVSKTPFIFLDVLFAILFFRFSWASNKAQWSTTAQLTRNVVSCYMCVVGKPVVGKPVVKNSRYTVTRHIV